MDIVLAMLADNAAKQLEEKRWERFPYSMERHAEMNENVQNFALYRYIVNNAMRYPQEWVLNGYGVKALAHVHISGKEVVLHDVEILQKSEGLSNEIIESEITKTLNRASLDFPAYITESDNAALQTIEVTLPFEWKIMGAR